MTHIHLIDDDDWEEWDGDAEGLTEAERHSIAIDMVMDAMFILDRAVVPAAEFLEEMASHYRNGLTDVEGQA